MTNTIETEKFFLNLGPQHPSTHGVLRLGLTLDGEVILDAEPDIGFLHRGIEKLFEKRTYSQGIILTDRLDYLASMSNNLAYCLCVEKLLGDVSKPPERAEYIRVIVAELQRIASHLVFLGTYGVDIGALTPFLYAFGREREMIIDLFEDLCGARLTYNYIRLGGVAKNLPDGWIEKCKKFLEHFKPRIKEYDDLLSFNPIFLDRTKNIGILKPEIAMEFGVTGPNLRASGVKFDIRKNEPYSVYSKFNFEIPIGENGDCWDRYYVRVEEMRQSVRIIEQSLEKLPDGEIIAKVPKIIKPPVGDGYSHIESPRGDLGFYIVSDGSDKPYRVKTRRPTFVNLQILPEILKDWKVADIVAILGSIDIVLGESDA